MKEDREKGSLEDRAGEEKTGKVGERRGCGQKVLYERRINKMRKLKIESQDTLEFLSLFWSLWTKT